MGPRPLGFLASPQKQVVRVIVAAWFLVSSERTSGVHVLGE